MDGKKAKEDKYTIYEAYSIVLHEWTEALSTLGNSKHLPAVVFQLWVAYLQRVGVAFIQEDAWSNNFKSPTREESTNRSNTQLDKNEMMTPLNPSNTIHCWDDTEALTLLGKEIKKENVPVTPSTGLSSRSQILKRKMKNVNNAFSIRKSCRLGTKEHVQHEGNSSVEDISSTSGSDEDYKPYKKTAVRSYFRNAKHNMYTNIFIKKEIEDSVEVQDEEATAYWQALQNNDYEALWHIEGSKRIHRTEGNECNSNKIEKNSDGEGGENDSQDEKSNYIKTEVCGDSNKEEIPWLNYSREVNFRLKKDGDRKSEDSQHRKAERKKVQRHMNKNNTNIDEGSLEETNCKDEEMSLENDKEEEENSEDSEDDLAWEENNVKEEGIGDEKINLRLKINKNISKKPRKKVFPTRLQRKKNTPKKRYKPVTFDSHLGIQSFPYMMKVLLGLLYLAVLLAKEHILLMDMLRWCQEGLIPYLSAPYLVKSALKSYTVNIDLIRSLLHVPDSADVRKVAGQLSIFLSLQSLPKPPIENVIVHLASLLRLPEETATMAQELVTFYKKKKCRKSTLTVELPSVESQAMAALVVTLKIWCGINNLVEHHLSAVATRINAALGPSHSMAPLFSWDDWKRYITRLLWFCKQVDPLCGLIYSTSEIEVSMENRFLSELSQILTFCKCAPATCVTDVKKYPFVSTMLEAKGQSLQELFDRQRIVRASSDPFLGIVEQFIELQTEDEKQQSPELLKMGQDLQQTSFASHHLFWPHNILSIQQKLKNRGSRIILHPVKYPNVRHLKGTHTVIRKKNDLSLEESLTKALSFKNTNFSSSDHSSQSSDSEESYDSNIYMNASFVNNSTSTPASDHVRGTRIGMCYSSTDSSSDSTDLEDMCAKIDLSWSSADSSGGSSTSGNDAIDKILMNGFPSGSNDLLVPLPLYKVWRLRSKKTKQKDFWKNLPPDYRWLITLGSLVCSVSKQQLLSDVDSLENSL